MRNFDKRFNLLVVFWLSISLTTPVIHGLGYVEPGLFSRALLTAMVLAAFTLFIAYPVLAWALPLIMLAFTVSAWLAVPHIAEKIFLAIYQAVTTSYMFYPVVIITAVSLVLLLLLSRLKKPLPLLFAAGIAVFVPLWYLYVDSAYPAAASYALCWLMLLSYKRGRPLWGSHSESDTVKELRKSWLTYTSSVLFASLLFALLLPKSFGPVPFTSLHNWADARFPFLSDLRGGEAKNIRGDGEEFSLHASGYQETSQLGGPLWQDSAIMLEVRGNGAGLYLRGSVKYDYTGSSWIKSKVTENWTPAGSSDILTDYLDPVQIWIKHKRLRTATVFTLLYTEEITGFSHSLFKGEGDDAAQAGEVPLNREYAISGLKLAYRGNFAELETEVFTEFHHYLALPADLPLRVQELALDITRGQQGGYTAVKALESYLRRNYTYTKEAAVLPEGRDFTDFFLFDQKEGYCTSFATALAVMARVAGISTRYVEGFVVPDSPDRYGIYQVAGTNAHAWVEAYIPGIGWLPFEATPGFSTSDFLPPLSPQQADIPVVVTPGNDAVSPDPSDGEGTPTPFPDEPGYHSDPEKSAAMSLLNTLLLILLVAVLAAVVIIPLLAFYRWLRIRKSMQRLKRFSPRLRALGYYNLTLALLDRLGLGKYPGETPREYSMRIYRRVYTWNISFKEISEGVSLALYSGKEEVPPWLAEQMEEFYRSILDRYYTSVGKVAAFKEIYLQKKYY